MCAELQGENTQIVKGSNLNPNVQHFFWRSLSEDKCSSCILSEDTHTRTDARTQSGFCASIKRWTLGKEYDLRADQGEGSGRGVVGWWGWGFCSTVCAAVSGWVAWKISGSRSRCRAWPRCGCGCAGPGSWSWRMTWRSGDTCGAWPLCATWSGSACLTYWRRSPHTSGTYRRRHTETGGAGWKGEEERAEDPHTNANTDMGRGPIEKVWEAKKKKGKKDRQKVGHDNARIENNK